MLIIL